MTYSTADYRQLTDFQCLMHSWKELAPYNAAHVLRVSEGGSTTQDGVNLTGLSSQVRRWEEALNDALAQIADGKRLRVETSDLDLDSTIERELNRPFEAAEPPLRAIVVFAEDKHFLTLVYDHWFADSPSIRALLHRAFQRYVGGTCNLPSLRRVSPTRSASAVRAIASGVRTYRRHRRAARIHLRDSLDFHAGFFSRHFAPGTIRAIRQCARKQSAKVNDVFMAAAAHVLGHHTAAQRATSRRNEVAIASAVDLRDAEGDAMFGFDVSYFSVVLADSNRAGFNELVRAVAQQTSALKTQNEVARFNLGLKCARFAWHLTSKPKRRAELFRKGLPLVAGISNVNLSGTWVEDAAQVANGARLLDYLRVSPVGPLLPIVFTLTTIGDRLSLCVSFRTTAFSKQRATELTDAFMSKLIAFSEGAV